MRQSRPWMSIPRCLIVDAEAQSAEILAGIIRPHGFSTHVIDKPFDALRHLRDNDYDLVLFEVSNTGADGRFVLEQVHREMPEVSDRTIVVASNPVVASDVVGGIAIIGLSDLKPMLRYLGSGS